MKKLFLAASCSLLVDYGVAAEPTLSSAIFGTVVDSSCEELSAPLESGAVAAWLASFAVKTVIGYASTLLENSNERSTVRRIGTAPGFLYIWEKGKWAPASTCIRFWYARQGSLEIAEDESINYNVNPVLSAKWRQLGFIEQPYLYGEMRLVPRRNDNAFYIQPVLLFARTQPEATGIFRRSTRLLVAVDLRGIGSDSTFGTHSIEVPEVNKGSILLSGTALRGLASSWGSMPKPVSDKQVAGELSAGPFSAIVAFTSDSDGTLFGKTLASTFKAEKDSLVTALTPRTKEQRAAEEEKEVTTAFDAVAGVMKAQGALDAENDPTRKPQLELELRKAQYLADLRLQAAGLPKRYNVSGP